MTSGSAELEPSQVLVISRAVIEPDVEVASRFEERVVVLLMNGEREDCRVVLEHERSAVSVVHIAVDRSGALQAAVALEDPDRDRDIVEQAEAFSVVGKCVMEAAAEMRGAPVFAGERGRLTRSTGHQPEPVGNPRQPGKLQHGDLVIGQRRGPDLVEGIPRCGRARGPPTSTSQARRRTRDRQHVVQRDVRRSDGI